MTGNRLYSRPYLHCVSRVVSAPFMPRNLSENALMSSLRPATLLRRSCQLRRLFYANRISSLDILVYSESCQGRIVSSPRYLSMNSSTARTIGRARAFFLEALNDVVSQYASHVLGMRNPVPGFLAVRRQSSSSLEALSGLLARCCKDSGIPWKHNGLC